MRKVGVEFSQHYSTPYRGHWVTNKTCEEDGRGYCNMSAPKSGSEFAQSTTNDVQKKSTHRRRSEELVACGCSKTHTKTHVPEIYDHYVGVPQ